MAEVLVKFTAPVQGRDGRWYWPQACGGIASDGLWEGWIEFEAEDGGTIRSGRETEQPNRADLVYWAEGLSDTYLEGSLGRALRLESGPPVVGVETSSQPRFERPASDRPVVLAPPTIEPHAILDPFAVYANGADTLRRQLNALSRDQLRNIALAYRLSDASPRSVLEDGSATQLVEHIVSSVRRSFERVDPRRQTQEHPPDAA